MRKFYLFLFVFILVMLVGCENDDNPANQGETDETQALEETEDEEEGAKEKEKNEGEDDKKELSSKPTEALGVLDAVGEAMGQVTGMAIEGEVESRVAIGENLGIDEIQDITGEATFNPYVEHLNYEITSKFGGGKEDSEYYLNDEAMYAYTSADGWVVLPKVPTDFASVLKGANYKNYSKHHDEFELSEENGNYLLVFEGEGDIYKEVIYGGIKDIWGEEVYEAVTTLFDGMSGTYQMTVDKDTFHLVSSTHESETIDGEINSETSLSFKYSKFNEVDEVVIPDDVIEGAGKLPGME